MESKAHILVIPFPVQGHINPMVQFSKRLAAKGPKITLITTNTITETINNQPRSNISIGSSSISNNLKKQESESWDDFVSRFKDAVLQTLPMIIEQQSSKGYPVKLVVYDSMMPYVVEPAKGLGVCVAAFFTQSCAVDAIYYNMQEGTLKIPVLEDGNLSIPLMPFLEAKDLPDMNLYPNLLSINISQFSNIERLDWVLINSFDKLENEVAKWMASKWPTKTIGPTIPSMYLDKRLEDDKDYGLSLFKPNVDACLKWLNSKDNYSVVYVSFGSLAILEKEQMEELASGLVRSNMYFLWVVRASEESKVPKKLLSEISEKGLVVNWCPQLQVLAHRAVGCFMTHCGWNSTLEALSSGVPMVAMPQWTDQLTNSKYIADVWRVGIRVRVNGNGIVTSEEIDACIKEVMEGEMRDELRKNAVMWKELAKEAAGEGGSSDKNIEDLVSALVKI